jgi:hypothetical protein
MIVLKVMSVLMMSWILWMTTYLVMWQVRSYRMARVFEGNYGERFGELRSESLLPMLRKGLIRGVAVWLFTVATLSLCFYWLFWDTNAS